MKTICFSILVVFGILFAGCSGSDTYRGNWKGLSPSGEKVEITFEAKKMTINDGSQESVALNYTQNRVSINNAVETYGIKLDDGRGYQINFPIANDESVGFLKDEMGNLLYIISRKGYIKSEDIYKLK